MTNFIHPETREDEIFFTNSNQSEFDNIDWKTKRKGVVAYDGAGNLTNNIDWFPVFISKKELEDSSKTLKNIRQEFRKKHIVLR